MLKGFKFNPKILYLSILILGLLTNFGCIKTEQTKIVLTLDHSENYSKALLQQTLKGITKRVNMFVYGFDSTNINMNKKGQIIIQVPKKVVSDKFLDVLTITGEITFQTDNRAFLFSDFKSINLRKNAKGFSIYFRLNEADTKAFADIASNNIGRYLAVYIDDKVLFKGIIKYPMVNGQGVINLGKIEKDEAEKIAMVMKAGALPIPVKIVK